MMKLTHKGLAVSTINGVALSAIAAEYKPHDDLISPTLTGIVRIAKEVVRRTAKPPGPGKQPIPVEWLILFAKHCDFNDAEQVGELFQLIHMMAAFLRESESVAFDPEEIYLEIMEGEEVLVTYVDKAKNDQGRIGHTILLGAAVHHPLLCPIAWYKLWTGLMSGRPRKKFFCNPDGSARHTTDPNKILKKLLDRHLPDVDASLYGSHSLRKGGCTEAARKGVELMLLKRHGNWKSDAVFIYIKSGLQDRLSVARSFI
jgi:hypothetical protein